MTFPKREKKKTLNHTYTSAIMILTPLLEVKFGPIFAKMSNIFSQDDHVRGHVLDMHEK